MNYHRHDAKLSVGIEGNLWKLLHPRQICRYLTHTYDRVKTILVVKQIINCVDEASKYVTCIPRFIPSESDLEPHDIRYPGYSALYTLVLRLEGKSDPNDRESCVRQASKSPTPDSPEVGILIEFGNCLIL